MGIGELSRRGAVFLDRDGVINCNVLDPRTGRYGAPLLPEDFELAPGAVPAMVALRQEGYPLFLVSNQPNYAKGKSSLEDLAAIHARLEEALRPAGVDFTAVYYCFHHPDGVVAGYSGPCACRKPSPYFLRKAEEDFGIDLQASWMIGDRVADIECGRAAGARTIRVHEDHPAVRQLGEARADFEARDLAEAVAVLLRNSPRNAAP